MSGFTFRGKHSSLFGIYTQDQSRVLAPSRREGKIVIPGRSGYYDGVRRSIYDERQEIIQCGFVKPEGRTVPELCREIAWWLSGEGRLIYDKEPDKYYIARLTGAPPMEQHLHYGQFTLTWSCNPPFAFGRTVTVPIRTGETAIDYRGTAETPCLIILRNTSKTACVNITLTAKRRE